MWILGLKGLKPSKEYDSFLLELSNPGLVTIDLLIIDKFSDVQGE